MSANLERVRCRIAAALDRAKRPADSPTAVGSCRLLAVTKNRTPAEVDALARAGQADFGENRVQEAAAKIPEVHADAHWHLIGHLQRNKVKKALDVFECVHSVDSVRLLEALGRAAEGRSREIDVLFEVNVSGEETKHGFRLDHDRAAPAAPAIPSLEDGAGAARRRAVASKELEEACRRVRDFPALRLRGLMTMAPFLAGGENPQTLRPVFRSLRELRDRLNDSGAPPEPMTELSMGMSQDYEVAVEEGATWVRVGTALFEGY